MYEMLVINMTTLGVWQMGANDKYSEHNLVIHDTLLLRIYHDIHRDARIDILSPLPWLASVPIPKTRDDQSYMAVIPNEYPRKLYGDELGVDIHLIRTDNSALVRHDTTLPQLLRSYEAPFPSTCTAASIEEGVWLARTTDLRTVFDR